MNDVLQELIFNEQIDTLKVEVVFVIKTDSFRTSIISKDFEIEPDRVWDKGDKFKSKQLNTNTQQIELVELQRPWGLWEINTSIHINSLEVEDHFIYLINLFRNKKAMIDQYLNNRECTIHIFIYKESKSDEIEYDVKTDTLKEICEYCEKISFNNLSRSGLAPDEK